MNSTDVIIIGFGIVLIILYLFLKSTKVPKQLYKSKSVYSDHREKPEKAFFSQRYRLTGKPDFILHTKDGLLPLEIKHSSRPEQPYFSHVMQLVSYCLLMEEEKGVKPKYGFIQYKGGQPFSVPYTEAMKEKLLEIMGEMRGFIEAGEGPEVVRKGRCGKCNREGECFGK
tara:strand:- start:2773 stop:3282 length:510 start_codon:yes stop_codon:yes gene_type:complete